MASFSTTPIIFDYCSEISMLAAQAATTTTPISMDLSKFHLLLRHNQPPAIQSTLATPQLAELPAKFISSEQTSLKVLKNILGGWGAAWGGVGEEVGNGEIALMIENALEQGNTQALGGELMVASMCPGRFLQCHHDLSARCFLQLRSCMCTSCNGRMKVPFKMLSTDAMLWESVESEKRQQCLGLLFYNELLHVFYLLRICDYKNAVQHVDKLDAAMNLKLRDRSALSAKQAHLEEQLNNLTGNDRDFSEPIYFGSARRTWEDKLELAPPPIDGEWLPKGAIYVLVDLTVAVCSVKGLFKECLKRIQSGPHKLFKRSWKSMGFLME
ncbi:hypothetical protein HAX54_047140 [Datura stramonium]|uniref:Uncharacterized protein n=1 Tax=Datura stramonium TaxID=4076 RepID=A0ABS8WLQ2_DATST|nr:hypothetical protein [Datura stramonium]